MGKKISTIAGKKPFKMVKKLGYEVIHTKGLPVNSGRLWIDVPRPPKKKADPNAFRELANAIMTSSLPEKVMRKKGMHKQLKGDGVSFDTRTLIAMRLRGIADLITLCGGKLETLEYNNDEANFRLTYENQENGQLTEINHEW
jgi:hypothetical protein